MSKLFLFGIGGTGSRIIKSLSFLLASGVELTECTEIVPIIVDPHETNKDLKRTTDILKLYEDIRAQLGENNNKFFNTKITSLPNLKANTKMSSKYTFNLLGVSGNKFKNFLDYDSLDEGNKALVDLLFSKENLEGNMDIGFVGNPHIGSVVLNQFKYSEEFHTFANNFSSGDRVFIISSIFGGTGASGFPTILKNIRTASQNPTIAASEIIENAPIGALSVLPYFNIEHKEDSQIQKAEWIQKTKSALSYYEKNVTGNDSVNVMYYLGDTLTKTYPNDPGDGGQRNDAHLIEFVGALSVIEFANTPAAHLQCRGGKAIDAFAKGYGIKEDLPELNFTHLGNRTEDLVGRNLIQMSLFYKFITHHSKTKTSSQPYQIAEDPKLDDSFYQTIFYRDHMLSFFKFFKEWMDENKKNKRSFNPVNLDNDFGETVNGIESKAIGLLGRSRFGYNEVVKELNKSAEGTSYKTKELKFINLFYDAMANIISNNYDRF